MLLIVIQLVTPLELSTHHESRSLYLCRTSALTIIIIVNTYYMWFHLHSIYVDKAIAALLRALHIL